MTETISILFKQLINASFEASKQPWGRKLHHFRYRMAWELRPALQRPGAFPLAVDVELASYCNFRCTMCQQASNWWNKEKISVKESFMKWDVFKKVVDECVEMGVYSMKVNWRGEPTANPDLPKYVRYMKDSGIHEVQMNTNASYLTVELADKIIKAGLDRIIFSCDGLSAETYNKIRIGGDFDKFMENLKMFKQRCGVHKQLGWIVPVIRINMSFQRANAHEVPQAREFFRDIADELRINEIYNPQQENEALGDERRQNKRKGCPQIYQRLIVSNDGAIIPCCVDFKKQLAVGNVETVSLRDAYTKRVSAIRAQHKAGRGRTMRSCNKCDNFSLKTVDENGNAVWN